MSKKNTETKSKSYLKYIIIVACVALIAGVGIFLGLRSKPEYDSVSLTEINNVINVDTETYDIIDSGKSNSSDETDEIYAKLEIGSLNPKRYIVQNYPNTTFYALYENGYGYQYNLNEKVNEKNDYQSELKALDMTVTEAYWLKYNSQKIYLYFTESNGSYTAVVSNFAF